MANRYRVVARGLKTFLPGWSPPLPGGTESARYCYSVWLRHLARLHQTGLSGYPEVIAETPNRGVARIGPCGSSRRCAPLCRIGRCAVCGERREHPRIRRAHQEPPKSRADLPGDSELPRVHPRLSSYRFSDVYSNPDGLLDSLAPERIQSLRRDLNALTTDAGEGAISYICPWFASDVIDENSVDVAYSQAVLGASLVDDLEGTYAALFRWMKPGAMMSHQIDFKCHGMTAEWNGHWSYSELVWKAIRGRRPYLLNRQVLSTHLDLQERAGFRIVAVDRVRDEGGLPRRRLARRYQNISDEDLTTSGAHVISVKY